MEESKRKKIGSILVGLFVILVSVVWSGLNIFNHGFLLGEQILPIILFLVSIVVVILNLPIFSKWSEKQRTMFLVKFTLYVVGIGVILLLFLSLRRLF